jgi:SAM-dependent methyltransferase
VLQQLYEAFADFEEAFYAALDESLDPRGPDVLFELVERMGLPAGSRAVDVGCGEGRHSLELARRFGFDVLGIDPVPRQVEVARASAVDFDVRFEVGAAEELPLEEASVDLVWCRDVLAHVADLERAYGEFRRVLRPGGRALIYQALAGTRLEPREAAELWSATGIVPASADRERVEAAIAGAGFRVDETIDLREWGERAEETSGKGGRRLLYASRLLRDPRRYVERFGQAAYETMLADSLWHVYGMIGKLDRRAYVLTRP